MEDKLPLRRKGNILRDNMGDIVLQCTRPAGSTAHYGKVIAERRAAFVVKACNEHDKLKRDNVAMLEALEVVDICLKREVCGNCPVDSKCPPDGSSQIVKQAIALAKGE